MRPKAGEVWRFLVDTTPVSSEPANRRWVQVPIPPGQERNLFAARPELRIPGTAPMTYVDDPTPTAVPCWCDEDEYGHNGLGHYGEKYSPPRLVLGAWGRTPAQAAAAESQAKTAASWEASMAEFV